MHEVITSAIWPVVSAIITIIHPVACELFDSTMYPLHVTVHEIFKALSMVLAYYLRFREHYDDGKYTNYTKLHVCLCAQYTKCAITKKKGQLQHFPMKVNVLNPCVKQQLL